MTETTRVVVATGNPGKLAEIRAALTLPGWEFLSASELGGVAPQVEETGETFIENALLKATAFADEFGMAALADDSGLEVDALAGAPGVRSARFAGEDATDGANNALLLERLAGLASEQRAARFRCVMVLVQPDGDTISAQGACEGRIGKTPIGEGGFGYDPLFFPDATPGLAMAQLPMETKNSISHRGAALRALSEIIASR